MPTYLFSLGLLPVQDWIVQARRARDLRAGSVLLWHLMAGVLGRLEERGAEIVLPVVPEGESFKSVARVTFWQALVASYGLPNRTTGYLDAADDATAGALLGAFESEVVETRWAEWRRRHLGPGTQGGGTGAPEREFWRRVASGLAAYEATVGAAGDCPFSVVWAAERVDRSAAGDQVRLSQDLGRIDRLFREVKRSRPVRPWPAGARIGKCNQCGRREALWPSGPALAAGEESRGEYDRWRDDYERLSHLAWLERGARVKPGERLCWICLAKRMAGYSNRDYRFPSTGDVAVLPWVERVRREPELLGFLERVERTAMGQDDLGRTLHLPDEELPPTRTGSEDDADDPFRVDREAREAVDALRRAVQRFNGRRSRRSGDASDDSESGGAPPAIPQRPGRYLALLAFDGDGMGHRVQEDPVGVPRAMAGYAAGAAALLERSGAATFYLAGDEGLAMAAAARAVPLAIGLEKRFRDAFGGCSCATPPTVSVGICFFEHTRPIAGALEAARDALETAKRRDGKNALGVTVLTASGARWTVVRPFGAAWQRIAGAAGLVRRRRLAAGWAFEALRLAAELDGVAWDSFGDDLTPLRSELQRRFRRAILPRTGEGATARRKRADALWEEIGGSDWWQPERGEPPRPWPEQFHLVGFLARQDDPAAEGPGSEA